MNRSASPQLRKELLDEFYTECDELLTSARAASGVLEGRGAGPETVRENVESIFRSVHSLKGLAAIVGLRPAERLAHGMEDILRGLSQRKIEFSPAAMDVLLMAMQRFEQVIAAHRSAAESPEIADALGALRQLANRPAPSPRSKESASAPLPEGSQDRSGRGGSRPRLCSPGFVPLPLRWPSISGESTSPRFGLAWEKSEKSSAPSRWFARTGRSFSSLPLACAMDPPRTRGKGERRDEFPAAGEKE